MQDQVRQSEREVIGCVAASHASYLNAARTLSADDFAGPAHQRVFAAAEQIGDAITGWHNAADLVLHRHGARFWGLPDVEHVRVVAIADVAEVHAGELWGLVRARTTLTDENGRYATVVAEAARRRRERTELEERLGQLEWAS